MKTKLHVCLLLSAAFAAGWLLYTPLRADGPCFEVAPMQASSAMERMHGKRRRSCEQIECDEGLDCPCDYVVVNVTLNTPIPTARYCTNRRYRCADDFDLVRESNGSIRQSKIGEVLACAIECETIRVGGKYFIHRCQSDPEAEIRNVYASHYVLTGDACPHG